SFWDPEFLFIDGPLRLRATQLVGVFLVAVSGAMVVGIIQALRRRSADDVLLLVGLLSGPLVASLGGEAQTIWRTLQMAPFGVLLGVVGLRSLWNGGSSLPSRAAMVIVFVIPIVLASWFHDVLPHAQALVRAASVPLMVVGFSALFVPVAIDRADLPGAALVAAVVIV